MPLYPSSLVACGRETAEHLAPGPPPRSARASRSNTPDSTRNGTARTVPRSPDALHEEQREDEGHAYAARRREHGADAIAFTGAQHHCTCGIEGVRVGRMHRRPLRVRRVRQYRAAAVPLTGMCGTGCGLDAEPQTLLPCPPRQVDVLADVGPAARGDGACVCLDRGRISREPGLRRGEGGVEPVEGRERRGPHQEDRIR